MKSWILAHRIGIGAVAIAVVAFAGVGYIAWTAAKQPTVTTNMAAGASTAGRGDLMFVDLGDGQDRVTGVRIDQVDGPRTVTSLRCQRYYRSANTGVCLRLAGPGPSYEAAILAADGSVSRTIALPGTPSRARVSASGNVVSWTSFVTGDSYELSGGFSTRSGFFDVRTGEVTESIEDFTATVGSARITAVDVNYWGITVASDDRTFYATLASNGRTWLMRGDLAAKTVQDVRPNAECPSLSPDGGKIAYKKRVNRLQPWSLAVFDLRTGEERILPDTVGIDDQAAWLDDATLAYGSAKGNEKKGIYFVPADGSRGGRLAIPNAASPVAVH